MAVAIGQEVEVLIEKPASGGRMIARHDGEVLLVAGAIPGERLVAVVTRAEKRVAFADTARVLETSPDRRPPAGDPTCGGTLYSHIAYNRQVRLKAEIIRDAYTRIGRIPIEGDIAVAASSEHGYRMRARFHVSEGRPGFTGKARASFVIRARPGSCSMPRSMRWRRPSRRCRRRALSRCRWCYPRTWPPISGRFTWTCATPNLRRKRWSVR